jgi:phosphoenolpyruvate-protein kinase (PTS system EI component)
MRFTGLPVSDGQATGQLYLADIDAAADPAADATPEQVGAAFAAVTADRFALAGRLRAAGREDEAGIVEISALIAADPVLVEPAVSAVREGQDASTAVREAAEARAAVIAAAASPELAERAGDVRQVAGAVLEHLTGGVAPQRPDGDFILVRHEVSATDLIEMAEAGLTGAVSVAGGASSHAAIIARGLGVPMLSGVDAAVLAAPAGQLAVLDADAGELIIGPATARLPAGVPASAASGRPARPAAPPLSGGGGRDERDGRGEWNERGESDERDGLDEQHVLAARSGRTADGCEVAVLCNVASAAETRLGLAAGAAGVGLLRTEIPFTAARSWPTAGEHRAQLDPILGLLAGRTATVRLLDFSGDKVPPFLRDAVPHRAGAAAGLAALLGDPDALSDQLRAILQAGRDSRLAVMVPMVSSPAEVSVVRAELARAAAALGADPPRLGIMVELAAAAAAAATFAPLVDFFSIGTNDLAGQVLGLDRRDPAARPALAADPRVLTLIGRVVNAGRAAGLPVSVCGDSAADPAVLPLLIGLGVDTLSVPAARVGRVLSWVSELDARACAAVAARALRASSAEQVWELVSRR